MWLRFAPGCVQGFPIIFHGVMGKDEREGNSPSFFNPEEAAKVTDYLKQLLTSSSKKGKGHLSPRHVGVISPYRKQVRPSAGMRVEPVPPAPPDGSSFIARALGTGPRSSGLCWPRIWEAPRSAALPLCLPAPWPPALLTLCCTGVMG